MPVQEIGRGVAAKAVDCVMAPVLAVSVRARAPIRILRRMFLVLLYRVAELVAGSICAEVTPLALLKSLRKFPVAVPPESFRRHKVTCADVVGCAPDFTWPCTKMYISLVGQGEPGPPAALTEDMVRKTARPSLREKGTSLRCFLKLLVARAREFHESLV